MSVRGRTTRTPCPERKCLTLCVTSRRAPAPIAAARIATSFVSTSLRARSGPASPAAKVTRQGKAGATSFPASSIPRIDFPGLFALTSSEPLIDNQRALPVFWKRP